VPTNRTSSATAKRSSAPRAARLGRGFGALVEESIAQFEQSARMIPIAELHPNPHQPRAHFGEQVLKELAASIKSYGIIQPLIVEERAHGDYLIIAGERRFLAANIAGLREVPAICRTRDEARRLELALIENIHRSDLNAIEEARAYRDILDQTAMTQENLALRMGRARSTITNSLRILTLPKEIQGMIERGELSAGHARALLIINDRTGQRALAREIVQNGYSVRESEERARREEERRRGSAAQKGARPLNDHERDHEARGGNAAKARTSELAAVEDRLQEELLTKVAIQGDNEKGKISIYYHSLNDLNRIYKKICDIGD